MKYIVIKELAGRISGEVWEGDLVEAAINDGLNIDVYDSPAAVDREFDLDEDEERAIAARWKAEAEKIGYPAARITEDNTSGEYWVPARGSFKLDAAMDFYGDWSGGKEQFIACPNKSEAAFLMRGTYDGERVGAGYCAPKTRLVRSLASKILRGEA